MAQGIGTVAVKKQRGKPTLITYGQTPRGQKFIKGHEELNADPKDKEKLKSEIARAVEKLFD